MLCISELLVAPCMHACMHACMPTQQTGNDLSTTASYRDGPCVVLSKRVRESTAES